VLVIALRAVAALLVEIGWRISQARVLSGFLRDVLSPIAQVDEAVPYFRDDWKSRFLSPMPIVTDGPQSDYSYSIPRKPSTL
jgi:hypothetical protein